MEKLFVWVIALIAIVAGVEAATSGQTIAAIVISNVTPPNASTGGGYTLTSDYTIQVTGFKQTYYPGQQFDALIYVLYNGILTTPNQMNVFIYKDNTLLSVYTPTPISIGTYRFNADLGNVLTGKYMLRVSVRDRDKEKHVDLNYTVSESGSQIFGPSKSSTVFSIPVIALLVIIVMSLIGLFFFAAYRRKKKEARR